MTRIESLNYVMAKLNLEDENEKAVHEVLSAIATSISKKSVSKAVLQKRETNATLQSAIYDFLMTVERATVKDIMTNVEECSSLTVQKISALISPMVKDGKVLRTVEKKVTFYSVPLDNEDESEV